eukprot:7384476-Prymnesium_polylepis.1
MCDAEREGLERLHGRLALVPAATCTSHVPEKEIAKRTPSAPSARVPRVSWSLELATHDNSHDRRPRGGRCRRATSDVSTLPQSHTGTVERRARGTAVGGPAELQRAVRRARAAIHGWSAR